MEKFNQEQLMLYLYGEASPILQFAIEQASKDDIALRREINILKRTKKQLEALKNKQFSPRQQSVDAVLKYAKQQDNNPLQSNTMNP